MPMTYRIDSDAGLLLVVGNGAITQSERLEAIQLATPSRVPPGPPHALRPLGRHVDPDDVGLHEIIALIDQQTASIGRKKVAMLTAAPVTYGVARQFQALTDSGPLQVRVFTDRTATLEWLDRESL